MKNVNLADHTGYDTIHAQLKDLPSKAIHRWLLLPFSSMPGSLSSKSVSESIEDLCMLEKKHMSQNPVGQSTACKPNREYSDSCMGNDQMILSAVLHEQGVSHAI